MPGWSEHWPTASVCARCACRDQAIHQSRWGDFSIVAFRVSGPARLAVRVVPLSSRAIIHLSTELDIGLTNEEP